jgi:murein DD-endopeptidase MepM/ murein hydrolase activator NlpD
MVKNKRSIAECNTCYQPVSNKDLSRMASGFCKLILFINNQMHAGLGFAAPQGTPIYATADGVVQTSGNTGSSYGNHVVINHG